MAFRSQFRVTEYPHSAKSGQEPRSRLPALSLSGGRPVQESPELVRSRHASPPEVGLDGRWQGSRETEK
ncbi:uncharacterized protein QC763_0030270 [Podospora pseudopauciseta]|uniref:Uncharacterized protein n=1 Tax=Podospora pseudopauciseta TaxID=2093780 RepID=A0ABR0HMZ7_9PEZI|nr:hypothetical protein QC763_0030270 [Podospora pseudopauciseta]